MSRDIVGNHRRLIKDYDQRLDEVIAERDEARARAAFLEQGLRDIEERLRTKTGPIREALKELKDPAVVEAWKWAVYGSCIHAQIVLGHLATAGEGDSL